MFSYYISRAEFSLIRPILLHFNQTTIKLEYVGHFFYVSGDQTQFIKFRGVTKLNRASVE